jgi:cyclic pyranopterin phosphate synthase
MSPQTAAALQRGDAPNGDVLGAARLAGIQAAKRTGELIPLAHPLALTFADVKASVDVLEGTVRTASIEQAGPAIAASVASAIELIVGDGSSHT